MLDQFEGTFTEIEDAFNNMVLIGREDEADDGLDVILDDMEEKEEEEEEEEGIDLVEGNEEEKEEEKGTDEMKRLVYAMHRLEVYCKELPILGFSSASYDISLIRSHLFEVLSEFGEATMFTVKSLPSTNASRPITSSSWMSSWGSLPLVTTYRPFSKLSTPVSRNHGLPYEYLKDATQLEETQLPPYEAFFSSIKHPSVLNEESAAYKKLLNKGKSSDGALKVLKLRDIPRSGPQNYQWLQQ